MRNIKIYNLLHMVRLSVLLALLLPTMGCSFIATGNSLSPYEQTGWVRTIRPWPEVALGDNYSYMHVCDDVQIRTWPIEVTSYGALGPLLIPIIPIPYNVASKDFKVFIDFTNLADNNIPEIAIKLPNIETPLLPGKVENVGSNNIKSARYSYEFNLNKKEVSTFEIVFLSRVKNCTIPGLSFRLNHNTVYAPLVLPAP